MGIFGETAEENAAYDRDSAYNASRRVRELEAELSAMRDSRKVMYGELLAAISGAIVTPAEGYEAAPWFLIADLRKIVDELNTARARLKTRPKPDPEILEAVKPDGGLYSLAPYIGWSVGDDEITLDGEFSLSQLCTIVAHVERTKA